MELHRLRPLKVGVLLTHKMLFSVLLNDRVFIIAAVVLGVTRQILSICGDNYTAMPRLSSESLRLRYQWY